MKRPCRQPGCAALVEKGFCAEHAAKAEVYDRARPSAAKRGYDWSWHNARRAALKRDGHLCQPCRRAGKTVAATEVDHVKELEDGGARLEQSNLESVCHSCHVAKTWRAKRARHA